jgi:hypothetical protein
MVSPTTTTTTTPKSSFTHLTPKAIANEERTRLVRTQQADTPTLKQLKKQQTQQQQQQYQQQQQLKQQKQQQQLQQQLAKQQKIQDKKEEKKLLQKHQQLFLDLLSKAQTDTPARPGKPCIVEWNTMVELYRAKDAAPPLSRQQINNFSSFYAYDSRGEAILLFNPPSSSDSDSSNSDMDEDSDYEAGNSDDDPNLLS